MNSSRRFILSAFSLASVLGTAQSAKVDEVIALAGMPCFTQFNAAFEGGGSNFCGPASGASALAYLAQAFPRLKADSGNPGNGPIELIKKLSRYMKTGFNVTYSRNFVRGIKRYVREADHAFQFDVHEQPTDLTPILSISTKTVAWLRIGRYQYDDATRKFARASGHYVAIAGFEKPGPLDIHPNRLVLSDPKYNDKYTYSNIKPLTGGRITGREVKNIHAAGQIHLPGLDEGGLMSILECIYVLKIEADDPLRSAARESKERHEEAKTAARLN